VELAACNRVNYWGVPARQGFRHADMSRFASAPPNLSRPQADAGTMSRASPAARRRSLNSKAITILMDGFIDASKSNRGQQCRPKVLFSYSNL
jgi:hypothetical protein